MKQPKSFEEGMDRLQGLLTQLQDETTPLADSVKLYAEAAGLIAAKLVVLPAPLGPITVTICPAPTSRLMLWMASTLP